MQAMPPAGEKLFLKGERCYTAKCAVDRRHKTPGDQLPRRRRVSDWGVQLREKQKARQAYGMLERQFQNYFRLARVQPGPTGANPPWAPGAAVRQRGLPARFRFG